MNIQTEVDPSTLLVWPKHLDCIGITKKEQKEITQKVKALQKLLPSKTSDSFPTVQVERSNQFPRRLLLTHKHAFIVLNQHGGELSLDKSGSSKKVSYVWDCEQGKLWSKESVFSSKQIHCIDYLSLGKNVGLSHLGLPEMLPDYRSESDKIKNQFFEKKSGVTLSQFFNSHENYNLNSIIGLVDALKKIHQVTYTPPSFKYLNEKSGERSCYGLCHVLFHGDISPKSIFCEIMGVSSNHKFVISNFYRLGSLDTMVWTEGWASPECIQFLNNHEKYAELPQDAFLAKYGEKKDVWAMGLIVGSILKKRFNCVHGHDLPPFSFIISKLKISKKGKIDESKIAAITQKEIDKEMRRLIKKEPSKPLKKVWKFVWKCLTVDPEKRPSLSEIKLK